MILPILAVKNVEASVAFYKEKLGFNHDFSMSGPDDSPIFAFVSTGKATLGLSAEADTANVGKGVMFMVYVPDETDIDAYYADVKARGTTISVEIKDEYWGDRCFVVHDPDGYIISMSKTIKQMALEEIEKAMKSGAS